MAESRHHFGEFWRQLRTSILARDAHSCACRGQCGELHSGLSARCGAPDRTRITRLVANPAHWQLPDLDTTAGFTAAWLEHVTVQLNIVHLNHQDTDMQPHNLAAFCQRCQLLHAGERNRDKARQARVAASSQGQLFGGPDAD